MSTTRIEDREEPPARVEPSATLLANPVIAVLRAPHATDYYAVAEALSEGGIQSIELTLSTPETLEHVRPLAQRLGAQVEIGVGTITTLNEACRAIDAGARFLVTPVVDPRIISLSVEHGLPVFPGGLTSTELLSAWRAGATAVKIFPAETVGPQYGLHLRGPFPGLRFVPSGGVTLESIPPWLNAGATAVSVGGPLVGDAFRGGSLNALTDRARRVVALAGEAAATR